jgi:hypothetical protein
MGNDDSCAVTVLNMANANGHAERIDGFPTPGFASEYARRRTRASLELLRQPGTDAAELKRLWSEAGEECCVADESYCASSELVRFITEPARGYDCDWWSLDPTLPHRYFLRAYLQDEDGHTAWLETFHTALTKPTDEDVLQLCAKEAAAEFAKQGYDDARPTKATISSLFEMPSVPRPPAPDSCPHWKIDLDFVCHDVKFGASASGVFAWPREPTGAFLDNFAWLLVDDTLSVRGDGPGFAAWSEIGTPTVELTTAPLTHVPTGW